MFDGVHKDIIRAINLFNDGMEEKALEVFNKVHEKGDLNPKDLHYLQFFKGYCFFFWGRLQEAFVDQFYKDCSNSKNPLFLIDATMLKFSLMYVQGRVFQFRENIAACEKKIAAGKSC